LARSQGVVGRPCRVLLATAASVACWTFAICRDVVQQRPR
jgi:hypothetical protein